jgi:hypothetical protein
MRHKSSTPETPSSQSPSERLVRDIRRATRKQYSAEEKIRIVLDGLRGEATIAELCRREGIQARCRCLVTLKDCRSCVISGLAKGVPLLLQVSGPRNVRRHRSQIEDHDRRQWRHILTRAIWH